MSRGCMATARPGEPGSGVRRMRCVRPLPYQGCDRMTVGKPEVPEMPDFSARRVCLSPQEKKRLVAVLRGFLEGLPEVRFAYLYGSFLDDVPVRDLDVGIFFDPALGREEVLDRVLDVGFDLGRLTGVNVDVQALNHAPPALKFHAVRGLLLLSRDEEERLSFVETAIRDYLNFKPLARQVLEDLLVP